MDRLKNGERMQPRGKWVGRKAVSANSPTSAIGEASEADSRVDLGGVGFDVVSRHTHALAEAIREARSDVILLASDSPEQDAAVASIRVVHPALCIAVLDTGGRWSTFHKPGAAPCWIPEVSQTLLLGLLQRSGESTH
jgi:hypothetical protein